MTKEGRSWPSYLLGGRVRTSTVVMIVVFCLVWWLYEEYKPAPQPAQAPATQVVPPGFVPDPAYTWVPRTNVQEPRRTTETSPATTTTTSPTTTTPTETTSPTSPTSSTGTSTSATPTTATSPTSPTTTAPPPGA